MQTQNTLPDWLWIGGTELCVEGSPDRAVIHASTGACYQGAVGAAESGFRGHTYVGLEQEHELFLRLPDPPSRNIERHCFTVFSEFAEAHRAEGRLIVIHCDTGRSSAPTLALLLLARMRLIPTDHFTAARAAFERLYPDYDPTDALARYVRWGWRPLIKRVRPNPGTLAARSASQSCDSCGCDGPIVAGHHTRRR